MQEEGSGDVRQRLDLETEQIGRGNEKLEVQSGLRVSIYDQQPKRELQKGQEASVATARLFHSRLFHYGERLRFPANSQPHATSATPARLTTGLT